MNATRVARLGRGHHGHITCIKDGSIAKTKMEACQLKMNGCKMDSRTEMLESRCAGCRPSCIDCSATASLLLTFTECGAAMPHEPGTTVGEDSNACRRHVRL